MFIAIKIQTYYFLNISFLDTFQQKFSFSILIISIIVSIIVLYYSYLGYIEGKIIMDSGRDNYPYSPENERFSFI